MRARVCTPSVRACERAIVFFFPSTPYANIYTHRSGVATFPLVSDNNFPRRHADEPLSSRRAYTRTTSYLPRPVPSSPRREHSRVGTARLWPCGRARTLNLARVRPSCRPRGSFLLNSEYIIYRRDYTYGATLNRVLKRKSPHFESGNTIARRNTVADTNRYRFRRAIAAAAFAGGERLSLLDGPDIKNDRKRVIDGH